MQTFVNVIWFMTISSASRLAPVRSRLVGGDGGSVCFGERFPLSDGLERKFAGEAVRRQVEELRAKANLCRPFWADYLDMF